MLIPRLHATSDFSPFVSLTMKSRWLHRRVYTDPSIVACALRLQVDHRSIGLCQWIVVVRASLDRPWDVVRAFVSIGSKGRGSASSGRLEWIAVLIYHEHQDLVF